MIRTVGVSCRDGFEDGLVSLVGRGAAPWHDGAYPCLNSFDLASGMSSKLGDDGISGQYGQRLMDLCIEGCGVFLIRERGLLLRQNCPGIGQFRLARPPLSALAYGVAFQHQPCFVKVGDLRQAE